MFRSPFMLWRSSRSPWRLPESIRNALTPTQVPSGRTMSPDCPINALPNQCNCKIRFGITASLETGGHQNKGHSAKGGDFLCAGRRSPVGEYQAASLVRRKFSILGAQIYEENGYRRRISLPLLYPAKIQIRSERRPHTPAIAAARNLRLQSG